MGDSMVVAVAAEGELRRTISRAACPRVRMGEEDKAVWTTYTVLDRDLDRIEISLSPTSRDATRHDARVSRPSR